MAEITHKPADNTELATEIELSGHHDTKLLAKDQKFKIVLSDFKKLMTRSYDALMKYSHGERKIKSNIA